MLTLLKVTPKKGPCLYVNPSFIISLRSHCGNEAVIELYGESSASAGRLTKINMTYEVKESVEDILRALNPKPTPLDAEPMIVEMPLGGLKTPAMERNDTVPYEGITQFVNSEEHLVIASKAQAIEYLKKNPPSQKKPLIINVPKIPIPFIQTPNSTNYREDECGLSPDQE